MAGIAALVLIIQKFEYFACLVRKMFIHALFECFGDKNVGNWKLVAFYFSKNTVIQN